MMYYSALLFKGAGRRANLKLACLFLPDPRGAGLHLAFQFSYVLTFGGSEGVTFVSLDQMLVPTHSLRDKGGILVGSVQ